MGRQPAHQVPKRLCRSLCARPLALLEASQRERGPRLLPQEHLERLQRRGVHSVTAQLERGLSRLRLSTAGQPWGTGARTSSASSSGPTSRRRSPASWRSTTAPNVKRERASRLLAGPASCAEAPACGTGAALACQSQGISARPPRKRVVRGKAKMLPGRFSRLTWLPAEARGSERMRSHRTAGCLSALRSTLTRSRDRLSCCS